MLTTCLLSSGTAGCHTDSGPNITGLIKVIMEYLARMQIMSSHTGDIVQGGGDDERLVELPVRASLFAFIYRSVCVQF